MSEMTCDGYHCCAYAPRVKELEAENARLMEFARTVKHIAKTVRTSSDAMDEADDAIADLEAGDEL